MKKAHQAASRKYQVTVPSAISRGILEAIISSTGGRLTSNSSPSPLTIRTLLPRWTIATPSCVVILAGRAHRVRPCRHAQAGIGHDDRGRQGREGGDDRHSPDAAIASEEADRSINDERQEKPDRRVDCPIADRRGGLGPEQAADQHSDEVERPKADDRLGRQSPVGEAALGAKMAKRCSCLASLGNLGAKPQCHACPLADVHRQSVEHFVGWAWNGAERHSF